jgi:uncharacterized protein (DUF2132 family)
VGYYGSDTLGELVISNVLMKNPIKSSLNFLQNGMGKEKSGNAYVSTEPKFEKKD